MFAGREAKKWTAGTVPTPALPAAAQPTSTTATPEQRQEEALTRFSQIQDDPKAVEGLLKEITGNLLSAERLISHLQSGRRLAQLGRDSTKASMVATNSNLLKVRNAYANVCPLCDACMCKVCCSCAVPLPGEHGHLPPHHQSVIIREGL